MKLSYETPEAAGMSPERIKLLKRSAQEWTDSATIPAIIVLHKAMGRLNGEADSPPAELDSIYPMVSITKPAADLWSSEGSSIWVYPEFDTIGVYLSVVIQENHKDTFGNMVLGAIKC